MFFLINLRKKNKIRTPKKEKQNDKVQKKAGENAAGALEARLGKCSKKHGPGDTNFSAGDRPCEAA